MKTKDKEVSGYPNIIGADFESDDNQVVKDAVSYTSEMFLRDKKGK